MYVLVLIVDGIHFSLHRVCDSEERELCTPVIPQGFPVSTCAARSGMDLKLEFSLKPSCYATILMRELLSQLGL